MTFIGLIMCLLAGHFVGVEAGLYTGMWVFALAITSLLDGLRFRDIEERLKNLEK